MSWKWMIETMTIYILISLKVVWSVFACHCISFADNCQSKLWMPFYIKLYIWRWLKVNSSPDADFVHITFSPGKRMNMKDVPTTFSPVPTPWTFFSFFLHQVSSWSRLCNLWFSFAVHSCRRVFLVFWTSFNFFWLDELFHFLYGL